MTTADDTRRTQHRDKLTIAQVRACGRPTSGVLGPACLTWRRARLASCLAACSDRPDKLARSR